ncbi:MAG TPA: nucleoside diphosphate kinase regulator [Terriglobales bacterium]|nr:nucleoside diphosphate kinase regulator [Terriglobales bacterium]
MSSTSLYLTETDARQLQIMLDRFELSHHDRDHRMALEEEIARARVVPASEIPPDVVRMHSRVRIVDMRTGEQMVFQIVYPEEANYSAGKISVLAPIGTALLGYRAGTEIDWRVPSGYRRLRIEAVEHTAKPMRTAA